MTALTLETTVADPAWKARWSIDGMPVGDFIAVDGPKVAGLLDASQRFVGLFEHRIGRPVLDPDALRGLGWTLSDAFVAPAKEPLKPAFAAIGPKSWSIRSDDPAVLDLPWELVELSPGLPVGCDLNWSLQRASTAHQAVPAGPTPPGPLRVLFLAAAPIDQHQLDYEREEDLMLRASADVKGDIIAHFAESGGIEELAQLVAECRPHVVHLSGHGDVDREGRGVFCFEDERGRTDLRTTDQIAQLVFRGHGVRHVFVDGCKTSQAAVSGLCRGLVEAGVPSALGWGASVADDRATEFTAAFYRRLVRNDPVPVAAAHARDVIRRSGLIDTPGYQQQDATFALPRLYGIGADVPLFDPSKRALSEGPRTVYALLGDGIKGLKSGYVGRRREVQRLVPALRRGETTFAVLTGIGGTGKSTLATRAANRLQAVGFGVIPVKITSRPTPAEAARDAASRILGAIDDAFLKAGRKDLHGLVADEDLATGQRLRLAVDGLNQLKLVLALDNFEDVLDLETRRIAHPDLAGFLDALARNLTGTSRAIVTCRYLPSGTPTDLDNVLHLPLPEFQPHDTFKFLRRDDLVDRRISRGELTRDLIDRLHHALGGTPELLRRVRILLRKADPNALLEELEGGDPGLLAKQREQYCSEILTTRLYTALSPSAQTLTRRLAISLLPTPADAAATLVELDEDQVINPLTEGVAYGLLQRFDEPNLPSLYHPPGLLRPWLAAPEMLAEGEAKAVHAHLAAYWRLSYEKDREDELRVAISTELETCRKHAREADDGPTFQWSSYRLARLLAARGRWPAARTLLEEVSEALRDADTWHSLATIDMNQGNYLAARDKFANSLQIRQDTGDREGVAALWHQLGTIDVEQGDIAAAREKFATALRIRQETGDREGEAGIWHNLATIDLRQSDFVAAREKFAISLRINQEIGGRAGEAASWHQIATIDLEEGDFVAAREKFGTSLSITQEIGDRASVAATWHNLATIDANQGDYPAAGEKFALSLNITQEIDDRVGEAATFFQLGWIANEMGQGDAAAQLAAVCWLIYRAIDHGDAAIALQGLSTLCSNLGYDQARLDLVLAEASASYSEDRGRALIERAFAEE